MGSLDKAIHALATELDCSESELIYALTGLLLPEEEAAQIRNRNNWK